MRRRFLLVTLLFLLLTLAGCTKHEKSGQTGLNDGIKAANGDEDNTGEVAEVAASGSSTVRNDDTTTTEPGGTKDASSETDYVALSEKLVLQMVDGEFDPTYDILSPIVKAQMSKKELTAAWYATVEGLGKYIAVSEHKLNTSDKYKVAAVILEFENNGLEISFTYNQSGKLDGLWFSYASLDIELEDNDVFKEIKITIGESPYPVEGILTLPKNATNPPVAILIHGSGTHDQDETIGPNKPFRDIAHGLASQGIATIRYKERLLQFPELASEVLTIQDDSLDDAAEAIAYAVRCGKIDNNRIFIIGHSLGGMMAPKIAADHKDVAGIICLAGSPRKLEDIIVDQNDNLIKNSDDYDDAQADVLMTLVKEQADKIKALREGNHELLLGIPAAYWHSLNQINIPKLAKDLNIPMLITQGSADGQVYSDKDYVEWQELLHDKNNVTFRLYDNLNHLFMTVSEGEDVLDYNTEKTVDQQVIKDMAEWIWNIN